MKLKDFDQRISEFYQNSKNKKKQQKKKINDFDQSLACNIKSLAVKKNYLIKPMSRFFNARFR